MKANPFCQTEASTWLSTGPTHQIPRLLENLLELAEYVPGVYETLPWLKNMNVWYLILDRLSDESEALQEATLTSFFTNVTQPVAEMIEEFYLSPHLRRIPIVTEMLSRMAQSVGVPALPLDVVAGVCYSLWHRRTSLLSQNPIQIQATTWFVGWWQSSVSVRSQQGARTPFLIQVIDEATNKVLAFKCTHAPPEGTDLLLTLYDALVFPSDDRWHLHPPARIHISCPAFPELLSAAKAWQIEIEEVMPCECAFLREWEEVLNRRILDAAQYLRIFDRACERTFGYAPLLAKQQAARRLGRRWRVEDDPAWFVPSLREVLPTYKASIGSDGTLAWRGWHYREMEHDLLRYWPGEAVTLRPSPSSEALIWVYWKQEMLCEAVAEELSHKDGSYHPYWFPYPRLGE